MARPDPYALKILDVTREASMFRLAPANPSSPDSVTITRDVFDKLLAIAESAQQASNPYPFGKSMRATETAKGFEVVVDGGQFGQFKGAGRTMLEAIIAAHRAYGAKLTSYIE